MAVYASKNDCCVSSIVSRRPLASPGPTVEVVYLRESVILFVVILESRATTLFIYFQKSEMKNRM